MNSITKKCNKCQEEKSLSSFSIKRYSKDGTPKYQVTCRNCVNAKRREGYPLVRIERIAKAKKWNKENKERKNENNKKSYTNNIEGRRASNRRYYQENIEKRRAGMREWYLANVERAAKYKREWLDNNKEKHLVSVHKRRARKKQAISTLTSAEWKDILASYNNKCVYCGAEAKEQDHLVPISMGGENTAENVVPACKKCNVTKGKKSLLNFLYYRKSYIKG